MKLIDADKLKVEVVHSGNIVCLPHFSLEQIDNAPTVNAIPIEWIKNYARHKASKGFTEIDCYWQSWEDDVLEMVADWEKENGEKTV